DFYEILKDSKDIVSDVMMIAKENILSHKRIIFGGDGYSKEWEKEAEKRGLVNLKTTPEAVARLLDDKNVRVFERFGVFTKAELEARHEIYMENYCTTISIEALTMIDLVKKEIIGSVLDYEASLAELVESKKAIGISCALETNLLSKISVLADSMGKKLENLENAVLGAKEPRSTDEKGMYYRKVIFTAMQELRIVVDELETLVDAKYWPLPSYTEMLFSVI
ncbi:MAG: glutamine synthetase, partial [Acutalibacteraceae bacterium]